MGKYFFLYFALSHTLHGQTQTLNIDSAQISFTYKVDLDSLEKLLAKKKEDTVKADILGVLSWRYAFLQPEKGLLYGQKGIELSQKLQYKKGIAYCTQTYAFDLWALGNYSTSLQFALDALHQSEELKNNTRIVFSYFVLACIYRDFGDYHRALLNIQKGIGMCPKSDDLLLRAGYAIIGSVYELQNSLDSAQFYVDKAHELDHKIGGGKWGWIYALMGNIQLKRNNYNEALAFYEKALPLVIEANTPKDIVDIYNSIAKLYKETGKIDSCIFYASEVLQKWSTVSYQKGVSEAVKTLAVAYKTKNERDSVMKYLELSVALDNKLFNQEKERDVQNMSFKEQLRQDEMTRQQAAFRNKLKMYGLIVAVVIFLLVALLLWRNNQHRKKAYTQLQKQKQETELQKTKVEETLAELQATQSQLIQAEKMASLGELTAGIAHEIQNPLNFVNNFSEVSNELVDEMNSELNKGDIEVARVIAGDIKQNLEKINHHGKRADSIVKGMLQHSRAGTGHKEPTDINKLTDEYLRLSYHGMRAKDKAFNAAFETDFDPAVGKINVVPQDIGRVILNLINNAFYAVSEKVKLQAASLPTGQAGYKPQVTVRSRKLGDKVEIKVEDNGNGIPKNVVDKIFQPFFTTKPTGQGTGLGLSLAYDIIKAHGGEIKVNTKEGEGAEFVIQLHAV